MNVILKQDVEGLGFEFEVVSVKPGYARNFLIPRGLAIVATPKNVEELNKVLEARKAEEDKLVAAAKEKVAKLDSLEVKIEAKVGSGDKLFGSVNNGDLAAALQAKGVEIEKKNIRIPGNTIKRLGKSVAKIRFHRDVEVDFEFDVVPDAASIKAAEDAAKTKAEMARLDAQKALKAQESNEVTFNFDNPLRPKVKEEKKEKVETVENSTEETASEE
ncbi:50S ribosomal protein L9 [Weeksella virosa]|uniref:Large ribosomal subunit protein bL9 n=1 Tax=Weeksella virosa (strain ATCC 43766 / DSM 16922 / JCM 21250 / CCUG 30538 / CDC 9751 / IAM 14551 / NBRC 16016 / NCTC 11634 / CL345/78) TaxID=865938 RepID=F0NZ67_WEEVC|nr:50S ribosomal protein L9 [Weeksella virosa]ADX68284.1 50S ribosomal protein L9 [Weeksella virosa DSM 16922]SUP54597.1 50S ribosomal protein L9 [Weeksella virosa]VEH64079.1 50S ribosomal protein L9 [Weeksella virosa]